MHNLSQIAGRFGVAGAAALFAAPLLFVCLSWVIGDSSHFSYFVSQGLVADYFVNTLVVALGSMALSAVIAVPAAWWVSMYVFPGRQVLQWALVLPLAVPSYIAAIVYGHLLEGAGPVQHWLRESFDMRYGEYPFPAIRSTGGAIFILSMTLYPYVYLMARGAFLMQSRQMLETGMMLGCSRSHLFTRLALPAARPALVAGLALVMMEALADFGVASLYGIPVFTTGIYRAWQGFYDPIAAARMASMLLILVVALLWLERRQRADAGFENTNALYHPLERWYPASRLKAWSMTLGCAIPMILGCIVPVMALISWSMGDISLWLDAQVLDAAFYSFIIAAVTALLAVAIGAFCAYGMRGKPSRITRASLLLATSGYALPGSVIAVGVLLLLVLAQNTALAGDILLTGTLAGLIWGCTLRFATIGFQSVRAGLEQVTLAVDEAATMLGETHWSRLRRIHLPLISGSAMAALMLVFIDTVKELPATLLLRPFDVSTLSIRVYELAKDEMLPLAAPMALLLIFLSLIPVLLLQRRFSTSRPGHA